MPRKVFIAYDHSKTSEHAIAWVLEHNVLLPDDEVVVATIIDEKPSAMYDPIIIQATVASASKWIAEDYKERVAALEKDAKGILINAAALIKKKGVSEPYGYFD